MKEILNCTGSTVVRKEQKNTFTPARNAGVNAVLKEVIQIRGITWCVNFVTDGGKRMAKAFRVSGYLVAIEDDTKESIEEALKEILYSGETWQQLHVEESEEFELDGEDKENCDLALLTRHFKKNDTDMQFDRPMPVAGQKYKHFKLGKIVTVIGISRHTETEEISVVYEYECTIWNRPLEMFMSDVDHEKYPDAKQKYRFELVEG